MSGHSKWATIHRQKEVKDAKRGAIFTKLAGTIAVAVKEGGRVSDPEKNFKLRLAIEKAKQFNMPKENISRAIEKGMGVSAEGGLEEILYEGFLPGGCGVLMTAVTDNKARTVQQVRTYLEKHGGTLAGTGAVGYLFRPLGEIRIRVDDSGTKDMQERELEIIDLGVEEVEAEDGGFIIYCRREETWNIKERLEALGYPVEGTDLILKPEMEVEVQGKEMQGKIEELLQGLEDMDDIIHVFTNYRPG